MNRRAAAVLGLSVAAGSLACTGGSEAKPEASLDSAAREPGTVKTPSGLVFRTLTPGHG